MSTKWMVGATFFKTTLFSVSMFTASLIPVAGAATPQLELRQICKEASAECQRLNTTESSPKAIAVRVSALASLGAEQIESARVVPTGAEAQLWIHLKREVMESLNQARGSASEFPVAYVVGQSVIATGEVQANPPQDTLIIQTLPGSNVLDRLPWLNEKTASGESPNAASKPGKINYLLIVWIALIPFAGAVVWFVRRQTKTQA